jgi:hypothetical protein
MANDQRINDPDDDIDYTAEGLTPPREKDDPTNEGYDEAAHSGNTYGITEGQGGVFGTSGGGTYDGGMHVEERQIPYEGGGDDSGKSAGVRGVRDEKTGTGE